MCIQFGYGFKEGYALRYFKSEEARYYCVVEDRLNARIAIYRLSGRINNFVPIADDFDPSPRTLIELAARNVPGAYRARARSAAAALLDTFEPLNEG